MTHDGLKFAAQILYVPGAKDSFSVFTE